MKNTTKNTAAKCLVQTLVTNGTKRAFCVPGESYLSVLDALYDVSDQIELITCRQEGGAAYMAEASGKLTGEPGICFVTRGPGATNASIGVHTAQQDSTPMILFIGQVPRNQLDREAFQEVDYVKMFDPLCKWVAQINNADRIAEYVTRAFHIAKSGRPGPVVLSLPVDMLIEEIDIPELLPAHTVGADAPTDRWKKLEEDLKIAERPLIILGGTIWDDQAVKNIRVFAEQNNLPVACAYRYQDLFDNRHPNYCGDIGIGLDPNLLERINNSDLIINIGARLGGLTTSGYSLFEVPFPKQKIVMIHSDADELGHVYRPYMAINASVKNAAKALSKISSTQSNNWPNWCPQANADYKRWNTPLKSVGDVDLGKVYDHLRENMPENAILTNGAGNYSFWLHRFMQYRKFKSQLAPTSGAMGYGLPAAVAAKATHRDRPVVCFAGDGCYMMNGQELATAMQYELPIVILLFNNNMYGTIRAHQERNFAHRVSGTDLINPDFTALAIAYGANGVKVSKTEEFGPAFDSALKADKATLIEITIDPQALTPAKTLSEIRDNK